MINNIWLTSADIGYRKLNEKYCYNRLGRFSNIRDALERCFYDEQCKGVFAAACGKLQADFTLCYDEDDYGHSYKKDCIYEKLGNLIAI